MGNRETMHKYSFFSGENVLEMVMAAHSCDIIRTTVHLTCKFYNYQFVSIFKNTQ